MNAFSFSLAVGGDDDLLLEISESVVEAVLDVEVGCVPRIKYSVE